MMEFNEKLQELRRQRGLTQEELAGHLYVSRTAVSKWESGRGYPTVDSLKAIAKFFSVTIDELLSGEEMPFPAEEAGGEKGSPKYDRVFGLLDCAALLLLFLPCFGQRAGGIIEEVSLLVLTGVEPYLKALYLMVVAGMGAWGTLTLALGNCRRMFWVRNKYNISLLLNGGGALLFAVSLQPYGAAFFLLLCTAKVFLMIKQP